MTKTPSVLADFEQAVLRLADALAQPEDEFLRDASIQRFEFCFELAWKSVQTVAREFGQEASSPRAALGIALRNGWVSDEAAWLDMLDARNRTSHTYREATAREVYGELPAFLGHLRRLSEELRAQRAAAGLG